MKSRLKKIILLVGDLAVMTASLYATLLIRYQHQPDNALWADHFWPFLIVFLFWIMIFYIADLYSLHTAANAGPFYAAAFRAIMVSGLAAAAWFYLNPGIGIAPKRNLLIYLAVFSVLFFLWRQIFNLLNKSFLPRNIVAFIGAGDLASELIREFAHKPQLGFETAFAFARAGDLAPDSKTELVSEARFIPDLVKIKRVGTLVLLADTLESADLRAALFHCLPHNIAFVELPVFYETVTGRVALASLSQMWFIKNLTEGDKSFYNFLKRLLDLSVSLAILMATWPLWIIIAIVIKIESAGPVFFRQSRLGFQGVPFTMFKFRTMIEVGNDRQPTDKGDRRITRVGNWLRRLRLDELPQAWNIFRGEMSFIGPRPERPELVAELETGIPFYRERMLVKPGVTGWDQVSGEYHSPSREDTLKKLQYDLFYIKHRSLYLDLSIALKTIATVLSRAGV